jgi:hypothetical protein
LNTNSSLRKFILSHTSISILNFYSRNFENADVDTAIKKFKKNNLQDNPNENIKLLEWTNQLSFTTDVPKSTFFNNHDFIINIESFKFGTTGPLISKLESSGKTLDMFATIKAGLSAYGVGDGMPAQTEEMKLNRIYHSKIKEDTDWYKYIEGEDVKRYLITWNKGEYIKWGKNLARPREWYLYSVPRILVRQIPSPPPHCINACYAEETFLNDRNSMNIIDISINPLYVLAVLNSKLISYWFIQKFGKLQRGIFPQFKINELKMFPMPITFEPYEKNIVSLVKDIMKKKSKSITSDTTDLENQLDKIIYSLYHLSPEEIETVEGSR